MRRLLSVVMLTAAVLVRSQPSPVEALIGARDPTLGICRESEWSELHDLYRPGGYAQLWFDAANRPDTNARDALAILGGAADDGLDPADYHAASLERLSALAIQSPIPAAEVPHLDVALSSAMLRYLRHLHTGRVDPRTIGFHLNAPLDRHDFPALLRAAIANHGIPGAIAVLAPPFAQYRALREMLVRYRSLAGDATLVSAPPVMQTVHQGQAFDGAALLYRRLVAFGDLPPDAISPRGARYESDLVGGVRHLQERLGLEPDGVLGKRTLTALGTPLT